MTIQRLHPGSRMSEAVRIGDIVFLAGQIPDDLTGDIAKQTREVLDNIDAVMDRRGDGRTWWQQGRHRVGSSLAQRYVGF